MGSSCSPLMKAGRGAAVIHLSRSLSLSQACPAYAQQHQAQPSRCSKSRCLCCMSSEPRGRQLATSIKAAYDGNKKPEDPGAHLEPVGKLGVDKVWHAHSGPLQQQYASAGLYTGNMQPQLVAKGQHDSGYTAAHRHSHPCLLWMVSNGVIILVCRLNHLRWHMGAQMQQARSSAQGQARPPCWGATLSLPQRPCPTVKVRCPWQNWHMAHVVMRLSNAHTFGQT